MTSRKSALIFAVALTAGLNGCGKDDPVKPVNHDPVVLSLDVFPSAIGPGDSTLVLCNATDSDGDALVYDWFTDRRLRIKGAYFGVYLYNTPTNTHVFYYGTPVAGDTAAWIQCVVRDSKGGSAGQLVWLPLRP